MAFLRPPFGKRHIIILGSLTFFLAIGLLFWWKMIVIQPAEPEDKTTVTIIQADDLRQDEHIQEGYALAQLNTPQSAWAEQKIVVLDVRSKADFQKAHLQGALSVPVDWLDRATLDPEAQVIVYSTDNSQLEKARYILSQKSINQVYLLSEPLDALEHRGHRISHNPD